MTSAFYGGYINYVAAQCSWITRSTRRSTVGADEIRLRQLQNDHSPSDASSTSAGLPALFGSLISASHPYAGTVNTCFAL